MSRRVNFPEDPDDMIDFPEEPEELSETGVMRVVEEAEGFSDTASFSIRKTPEDLRMEEVEVQKPNAKKHFTAKFLWVFSLVFSVTFAIAFIAAPMFPSKWKVLLLFAEAIILWITGVFSFMSPVRKDGTRRKKLGVKIVNVFLAVVLALGSVGLPYFQARITDMLRQNNIIGPKKIKMNLYVMSDEYKQAHKDLFEETGMRLSTEYSDPMKELEAYRGGFFITMLTVDNIYQQKAIDQLSKELDKSIKVKDQGSVNSAVKDLYNNNHSIMIMNEEYLDTILETEGYESFEMDTRVVYTVEVEEEIKEIPISNTDLIKEPFAVFIGGNDSEGELKLTGRTDVDMVLIVNPKTQQIGIFSFPRDSYIPNPALNDRPDKLTHLGMNGLDNTMAGLSNVLGIEIQNYVLLNFTTYINCVNALGGVYVDNPYYFYYSYDHSAEFPEGRIRLKDWPALAYVRERYSLPDGDFGRTMHQQLVLKAIIRKITSPEILIHFDKLLSALSGNFLTNVTSDAIYSFLQHQLNHSFNWKIVNYSVQGGTGGAITASAPGQELSCVFPYANQIEFMKEEIQKIYDGEVVEQQELPKGSGYLWNPIH